MITSYKGPAKIVNNEKRYKGLIQKGTSSGATWVGITILPMKKFFGNFHVVATDYENYAIIY